MSRKFLSSVCCSLFLLAASAVLLSAQVSKEANSGYQTKEQRERVASNLDRPEREKSQKPRELIAAIGVNNGDVIADIGSGVGFMLPYFLEAVGPGGKIYAEDIQQDFLDTVEEKKRENNWADVETILGDQKDPKLPEEQIDLGVCPTERKSPIFCPHLGSGSTTDHNWLGSNFSVGQTPSFRSRCFPSLQLSRRNHAQHPALPEAGWPAGDGRLLP